MKNPEEMTDEELRELLLAEMNGQAVDDQPRDEQGKFAAKAAPAEDEETVYQRIIDLGDGAGTQVFEGKSMEELIDKLAKAQEHASRKIREQAQALKERPAPLPVIEEEKQLSPDEQFLLQQRMLRDPMSVIKEFTQREIEKITAKQQSEAAAQAAAEAAAKASTDQWVENNPDYYASPKNGTKIQKYLEVHGLELTPENLTSAFTDLNESGLLEARPAEATKADPEEPVTQATRRIVEPTASTVTTVRRKVVGGISTKRSAPVVSSTPELTEKQLREMPFHELEQLMYQQARG